MFHKIGERGQIEMSPDMGLILKISLWIAVLAILAGGLYFLFRKIGV